MGPRLLLLLASLLAGCAQGEAPSEVEARVEEGLGTDISPVKAEIRETRDTENKETVKSSVEKKPQKKKAPKRKPNTRKKKQKSWRKNGSLKKKGKNKRKNRKQKDKLGKKRKKGNRKKKTKKKNSRNNRKKKKNKKPRQECRATDVDDACLINAVDALSFEKNQIQNFFKTKAQMERHKKVAGNKYDKNDKFNESATYMLMALGGDLKKPTCGDSTTSAPHRGVTAAMDNYETLANCSAAITEACEMPKGTHTMNETFYTDCSDIYNKTKEVSEDCRMNDMYTNDGAAACDCWQTTMEYITEIKKAKCTTKSKAQSIKMKKQRQGCINVFKKCKMAEDAAIALIHTCMSGEVDTNSGTNEDS